MKYETKVYWWVAIGTIIIFGGGIYDSRGYNNEKIFSLEKQEQIIEQKLLSLGLPYKIYNENKIYSKLKADAGYCLPERRCPKYKGDPYMWCEDEECYVELAPSSMIVSYYASSAVVSYYASTAPGLIINYN